MLDPRLYRVAFVPVLLALLVAAFSLQDRPRPVGTNQSPEGFDGIRAEQMLDDTLMRRFPDRRPGSPGDQRLAAFVAAQLQAEELGVPLAEALNDIAGDMRRLAYQNARRDAQRAAPRVSLLVTTLIVPGAMILILLSVYYATNGAGGNPFG